MYAGDRMKFLLVNWI